MRRRDKEIAGRPAIEDIIRRATVCRLGLSDGMQPYVVPLCFGYEEGVLYFHGAPVGRKLDVLRANPAVCFEFDLDVQVVPAEEACRWSMRYRSVIGFGRATVVHDRAEKRRALSIIVRQYAREESPLASEALRGTTVIRVEIDSMTAKQSGYAPA